MDNSPFSKTKNHGLYTSCSNRQTHTHTQPPPSCLSSIPPPLPSHPSPPCTHFHSSSGLIPPLPSLLSHPLPSPSLTLTSIPPVASSRPSHPSCPTPLPPPPSHSLPFLQRPHPAVLVQQLLHGVPWLQPVRLRALAVPQQDAEQARSHLHVHPQPVEDETNYVLGGGGGGGDRGGVREHLSASQLNP